MVTLISVPLNSCQAPKAPQHFDAARREASCGRHDINGAKSRVTSCLPSLIRASGDSYSDISQLRAPWLFTSTSMDIPKSTTPCSLDSWQCVDRQRHQMQPSWSIMDLHCVLVEYMCKYIYIHVLNIYNLDRHSAHYCKSPWKFAPSIRMSVLKHSNHCVLHFIG